MFEQSVEGSPATCSQVTLHCPVAYAVPLLQSSRVILLILSSEVKISDEPLLDENALTELDIALVFLQQR
jgi:hypothetical protein